MQIILSIKYFWWPAKTFLFQVSKILKSFNTFKTEWKSDVFGECDHGRELIDSPKSSLAEIIHHI